jgi:hypothetical protein
MPQDWERYCLFKCPDTNVVIQGTLKKSRKHDTIKGRKQSSSN